MSCAAAAPFTRRVHYRHYLKLIVAKITAARSHSRPLFPPSTAAPVLVAIAVVVLPERELDGGVVVRLPRIDAAPSHSPPILAAPYRKIIPHPVLLYREPEVVADPAGKGDVHHLGAPQVLDFPKRALEELVRRHVREDVQREDDEHEG